MATCEKCGKEFEAKGDWQKVCIDCYKAGATAAKSKVTKKAASAATGKHATAELFRKKYEELAVVFEDVYEDVKPHLGGWTTSLVLDELKKG